MDKTFVYHSKHGFGTRITIVGKQLEDKLVLAAARCCSKDNFSRKKGREIAFKRLDSGEYIKQFNIKDANSYTFVFMAENLAYNLLSLQSFIDSSAKFKNHEKSS